VLRLSAEGGGREALWQLVALELALALVGALLGRAIALLDALLGDRFANDSSERLIAHAARLDLPQFENAAFYDKLERARRQTIGRVMLISDVFSQVESLLGLGFLAAGLVAFNPWLIGILALAVLPTFVNETYFNRQGYSLARQWTPERRELDYLRYIGASDETAKEIKIFGLSEFLRQRFAEVAERYYQANKRLATARAAWAFLFSALGDLGYYAAYVFILLQTIAGAITIGSLTFLAGAFSRMRGQLQQILSRFSSIAERAMYLQDFFDFLDIAPAITSPERPVPFPAQIQEGFVFENVGFKYPNTEVWALRGVSFRLEAGEKLALVGENGAGKTTLVKLLARLYDPDEGRILLDGTDIRQFDLLELRRHIGVIFQDFVRFQFNVSDNIAVGSIEERADRPKIRQAAHLSLADDVISQLPEQYEQMLGRRFGNGVELSGGQWQKLALGRAYMRDAQVLILDEPTAALDARAEYEVFLRFSDLTKGKTAVLISHRFSTVRMADRILVLAKGRMQEIGSHEELMAQNGLYAELFNLQAEGYR
jgi:ATP-binding cassette subfamily B protein